MMALFGAKGGGRSGPTVGHHMCTAHTACNVHWLMYRLDSMQTASDIRGDATCCADLWGRSRPVTLIQAGLGLRSVLNPFRV
jgi:hypothetical protein